MDLNKLKARTISNAELDENKFGPDILRLTFTDGTTVEILINGSVKQIKELDG